MSTTEPEDLSALCIVGSNVRLNHKFSISGPCEYCSKPFPGGVLRPEKDPASSLTGMEAAGESK